MKTCTRLHEEDVEPGDQLEFTLDGEDDEKRVREFGDPYPEGVATVARIFHTRNFGWVVEGTNGETYYLNDYDRVEVARERQ